MIIKKETKNFITIYYVDKDYDDKKLEKILHTKLKSNNNFFIINEDADVYTKDNKLLLRYRKNKLDKKNIDEFYDNVIKFALTKTTTITHFNATSSIENNKKNRLFNGLMEKMSNGSLLLRSNYIILTVFQILFLILMFSYYLF